MYWKISVSINRDFIGKNGITVEEVEEQAYLNFNKFFEAGMKDFSRSQATGYMIKMVDSEEKLVEERENMITECYQFINDCINDAQVDIDFETKKIERLQNNPIFIAINRDKQINNILN